MLNMPFCLSYVLWQFTDDNDGTSVGNRMHVSADIEGASVDWFHKVLLFKKHDDFFHTSFNISIRLNYLAHLADAHVT